jgi:hypothetical protein
MLLCYLFSFHLFLEHNYFDAEDALGLFERQLQQSSQSTQRHYSHRGTVSDLLLLCKLLATLLLYKLLHNIFAVPVINVFVGIPDYFLSSSYFLNLI